MNSLSVLFRDGISSSYFSRKLFEFGASVNSVDRLDCSHGVLTVFYNKNFMSGRKFLSPSMKAVVRTCVCAISIDHSDFILFMFGSHSYWKSEWIHCQFYLETEVYIPILKESCSKFKLMQNFLMIWIAAMVHWQY